jgi:hypothetical protein
LKNSEGMMYPWQTPYQAALLEHDPEKLRIKVEAAELSVFERLQQLVGDSDHHVERAHIEEAVKALRIIQHQNLGFPRLPTEF